MISNALDWEVLADAPLQDLVELVLELKKHQYKPGICGLEKFKAYAIKKELIDLIKKELEELNEKSN